MYVLVLALVLAFPMPTSTSLRITVLDVSDQPVTALRLTLRDDTRSLNVLTDASGVASAQNLAGSSLYIIDAVLPDGTRLQIDPTTPRDGMRLGLILAQERAITLRLDPSNRLLFVDPVALFSGEVLPTPPSVLTDTDTAMPQVRRNPLLWLMVLILALTLFWAVVMWTMRVRAYRRLR